MDQKYTHPDGISLLLTLAAFVVVVAGMKAAQAILVPFLLAVFIAIITSPLMFYLRRIGIPSAFSVLLVVVAVLGFGFLTGKLVSSSINEFYSSLPAYQERLNLATDQLVQMAADAGFEVPEEMVDGALEPGKVMQLAGNILREMGGMLTNALMILLTVVFILLEMSGFRDKLRAAFGEVKTLFDSIDKFTFNIKRYMVIKTATSFATGFVIMLWLLFLGVDYPILWGLIAFMLNYVPTFGSILAAIPATLLALVQLDFTLALLTAAGYLVVNFVIGNLTEPRLMGRGLGLSTLVVFISLVFWGWVLGPIGMLLSVPLTMTIKIALESSNDTRWLAIILGPEIPESKPENPNSSLIRAGEADVSSSGEKRTAAGS